MYCEKCHKKSPDNFVSCAYCGAKFKTEKKKQPTAFVKKTRFKLNVSNKLIIAGLVGIAVVLCVAAIITAAVTGAKPKTVVETLVLSIEKNDSDLYLSLYDDELINYKKENYYYGESETYDNMVKPLQESRIFYEAKCGEDYKLKYKIISSTPMTDDEVTLFGKYLQQNFSYVLKPSQVEVLSVEIIAEGEKGEYKTQFDDFWCMKIQGKWYRVHKTVFEEYEKSKTTS